MIACGLTVIASALLAVAPPTSPTPREAFDRGRTAYGRAQYQEAIDLIHPLLYPEVLLDSEGEVVQAHRMLGVAHLFEDQPDDARREFRKLLELRPDYRFDPLLDPQRVVDFFNGVVKDEETEIAAIEARRHQREQALALRRQRDAARPAPVVTTIVRYEQHSLAINFIPFGAGQFQNGQRRKGWLFLSTEAALAALSVGAFTTNFALYGVEPHRKCLDATMPDSTGLQACAQIDHSQQNTSTLLLRIQLVTGGLFFAAAAWGVIDALRHYQRDVPLTDDPTGGVRLTLSPAGLGARLTF